MLSTERLQLREFVVEDAEFIIELLNQPSFIRFIGDKQVRTIDDAKKYLRSGPIDSYRRHGFGLYLVQLRDNQQPIGMCGVLKRESLPDPDLGFAFVPDYWGKGYAFEAASAVLHQAGEIFRLPRVLAITNPDNDSSLKLLEKLGFQFERVTKMSSDADQVKLFSLKFDTL